MSKLLLSLFILSAVSISHSHACQKMPDRDGPVLMDPIKPNIKYEETDIIFRGLATKTELIEAENLFEDSENFHYLKVHFKPIEILKGEISQSDYFLTYNGYIGGCAPTIVVGVQYLVLMSEESQVFRFNQLRVENKDETLKFFKQYDNSLGFLSIYNTNVLMPANPSLDRRMQDTREWVKREKE